VYPEERLFRRLPHIEVVLVDMRERDMTIKGQEILTSDRVPIRVSIMVRFRVVYPKAAVQTVENYESRIYVDAQLAARRALASMTLEEILTNRSRLNRSILADVKESAAGYGVEIGCADVKDLVFPRSLQEIMDRVLTAERMAEVQMIEARARAQMEHLGAQTQAKAQRLMAEALAEQTRLAATAEAEARRIRAEARLRDLREHEQTAADYANHPALMRLLELEALSDLSHTAPRLQVNFGPDGRVDAVTNR
jgi:regulator of protease activity HflC (stomatin/prohibitin superfamily)